MKPHTLIKDIGNAFKIDATKILETEMRAKDGNFCKAFQPGGMSPIEKLLLFKSLKRTKLAHWKLNKACKISVLKNNSKILWFKFNKKLIYHPHIIRDFLIWDNTEKLNLGSFYGSAVICKIYFTQIC